MNLAPGRILNHLLCEQAFGVIAAVSELADGEAIGGVASSGIRSSAISFWYP